MESKAPRRLLVATRNPGKVREYRQLLRGIPFEITSLEEIGIADEVEETGSTFEENACIKARAYAASSDLLSLADDSGLEVDALNGSPGVKSARYGGPGLTDEGRVALLLANMQNVKWEDRSGRFKCVIAIAQPSDEPETVTGAVEGIIQYEPKGGNGFGYDPVFYLPHLGRTMAELSLGEKNALSHRAQAAGKAVTLLKAYHPKLNKDSGQ
ncbi:MAG: XTP/dITP diphosphatase [Dehalococcoidia bacterium]|nr:XTP/dITP diphosphatase [Dehalococcoidia bacterium]